MARLGAARARRGEGGRALTILSPTAEAAAGIRTPAPSDISYHRTGSAEPPVRGAAIWRPLDVAFARLEAAVGRIVPEDLDPVARAGAVANTTFLVAVVTGIVLLFWYSPSVHQAHASVVAMDRARWTAGLVRSLHRYASDACLFFVLLHALRLFVAARFGGARWLAWVTGTLAVGLVWLVGWLGYWLVWDQRARQVALGTARMLDALPIFADPLSRGLVADQGVNTLLFFVVFFVHMLVPLAIGVALWLHIARVSRPRFLTGRRLTAAVVLGLVAVSLAAPADTATPARLAEAPAGFAMDWWYLAPMALTDRLGAGALWSIVLVGGIAVFGVPWWLAPRCAAPAEVDVARCNACRRCAEDCPYDAVRMVPRTDGRDRPVQSQVDPAKCVGCGICAGACDSAAIGLPWMPVVAERARIDRAIDEIAAAGRAPAVAFLCARGAAADLPGWHVVRVPCAGWVHARAIDRALRRGARDVLVAACGPGACTYREGAAWTDARLRGNREPAFQGDRARVHLVQAARGEGRRIAAEAARVLAGGRTHGTAGRTTRFALAVAGAVALSVLVWKPSAHAYAPAVAAAPTLVVSFKHPGRAAERCRDLGEDEKRKLPPHMRRDRVCDRQRAAVRMRVTVDGQPVVDRAYPPRGVWGDGNSTGLERVALPPGRHAVEVAITESAAPGPDGGATWTFRAAREVDFAPRAIRAVVFDKVAGFRWY